MERGAFLAFAVLAAFAASVPGAEAAAPALSSATIDRSTGAVTLTFSEAVTKSTGDIDIREGHSAAHTSSRDVRTAAGGSGVSASGSALTFTLSPADLAKVNAMSSPHVYLGSSVVTDSGGTASAALTAGLDAVLSPKLLGASLDSASSSLSIVFSESVSVPSGSAGNVYVASAGDANGFTSGQDLRLQLSGTAAVHTITVTGGDLVSILLDYNNPHVYVEANAVEASGLSNAAGSVRLTREPVLTSAAVNLETGAVTAQFDRRITAGTGSVDLVDGESATYDASRHVRVAVSDTTVDRLTNRMTFTLSEADRKKAIAMGSSLHLRLPAGAVVGVGSNSNDALTRAFDTVTYDTTAPALVTSGDDGPALDAGTKSLALTFSESVKDGADVDLTKIHVANSSSGTWTALSLAGDASEVTSTDDTDSAVTVKLRESLRQTALAYATPHVRLDAGAVKDLSDQDIAAVGGTAVNKIADDDAPLVASAALNEETGLLTITFDETVDVSSAAGNGASFEIREDANAADGSLGEVTLSNAEIRAGQADGAALVFDLSEGSRRAVINLGDPHLYVAAGAISDTAATPNSIAAKPAGTDISQTLDATAPTLVATGANRPALDEGTGILTLTFSESVKDGAGVDLTKIRIASSSSAAGTALSVSGDASTVTSADDGDSVITIRLRTALLQTVVGYETAYVRLDAGAVKDLSDQNIAASSSGTAIVAAADTTPPTLVASGDDGPALDESTGVLTLSFNEAVKTGDADVDQSKIFMRNNSFTTGGEALTDATVTSTGNGLSVTVKLTEAQRKSAIGYSEPHVLLDKGAVENLAGLDIAASAVSAEITDTADTTAPVLVTTGNGRPSLDEGTGALALTFSESVKDGADVDLTKIHVASSSSGTGTALSITGDASEVTSTDDTDAVVTVKLREALRLAAIGYATPHVRLDAGAVKDLSDQDIAASSSGTAIDDTADDDAPLVASAALNEATGILTVTFDETVDVSTASGNGASFEIREGANAADGSTGEVTLSDAEIQASQTDGLTFKFDLTEANRRDAIALSDPHLYVAAGAIADIATPVAHTIEANTAGTDISQTLDTTAPALVTSGEGRPSLDEATGVLTLTFSESVKDGADVDLTRIYMSGSSSVLQPSEAIFGVGSSVTSTDDTDAVITIKLRADLLRTAFGYEPPYVHFFGGSGVKDLSDQFVAAALTGAAVTKIADEDGPEVSSAALNEETGLLTITFNETVDVSTATDGTNFEIREGASATDGSSGEVTLSTSEIQASQTDGTSFVFELDEESRRDAISLSDPHLYVAAGAISDTAATPNSIAANTAGTDISQTLDATAPTLVATGANRPALDEGTGILTLTFSESVKDGAGADLTKIRIANNSSAAGTALSVAGDASEVTSTDDTDAVVTIKLREALRQTAAGYATPHVRLDAGAVKDLSDQDIAASSSGTAIDDTADDDAPLVASAALNEATGILTITFDETVDVSTASGNGSSFQIREGASAAGGSAGEVVLSDGEVQAGQTDGLTLKFELSESSRQGAIALADPHLYITASAIYDTAGQPANGIAAKPAGTDISQTADSAAPAVSSAAINEGTGLLTITFDETVDVSTASGNGASFEIREGANAADGSTGEVTLSTSEIQASQSDGAEFKFELTEANRQAVVSLTDPHLYIAAGAISDTSANAIAANASGTDISQTADTAGPEVSSAAVNEGTGLLTVTFDETVDVSTATDGTDFEIREGSNAADNSPGEVTLSTSEIQSSQSDGAEFKFELTEANRQAVVSLTDPHLYIAAGAISDTSANAIAANASGTDISQTADTAGPEVSSAAVNEGTGLLTVTFDETVDVSSANGASFEIREGAGAADGSSGEVTLSNAEIQAGQSDGAEFKFELTEANRQGVIALNSPHLYVAAGAITDVVAPTASAGAAGAVLSVTPDSIAPTIVSAEATAGNKVTVEFSETVSTTATGGQGWSISGADAGSIRVDQNSSISSGSTTVVLTLDASLPDGTPDIVLRYETSGVDVGGDPGSASGRISDTSSNALAARQGIPVSDGIAPTVSATYTSRNSIDLEFSEPVRLSSGGSPAGWGVSGADRGSATGASSISVITESVTSTSATVTLDGSLADKTLLDFTLSYEASGNIEDTAGNGLAPYSATPSDGIAPRITFAEARTLNAVTVAFSEGVTATGTSGAGGWTLSGADSGSLTVLSRSDISQTASDELTLALSGNLGDPIGAVTLNYAEGDGDVADESDNALASGTASVAQDLAPAVSSAKVAGPDSVVIEYSEAVAAARADYSSLVVDGEPRTISGLSGGATDKHTISFTGGAAFGTDAVGSVSIDSAQVKDASDNALGAGPVLQPLADGQSPAVSSATYTSHNSVDIAFSEPVRLSGGTAPTGWSATGADVPAATSGSTITVLTASATATAATLTLDNDLADKTLLDFTLAYDADTGNIEDDDGNALAAYSAKPADGIAPTITSAEYPHTSSIEVTFSEPVTLTTNGPPTGWSISGPDAGTVTRIASLADITDSSAVTSDTLGFDGVLADKTLLDITLSYAGGNIEDQSDNALADYSATPSDGIAPRIDSAEITGPDTVVVTYSENATAAAADYAPTVDGAARTVSNLAGSGTAAHTVTFAGGAAVGTGATGSVSIDSAQVKDASDNALGASAALSQTLADGQAPIVVSTEVTGPGTISATFSESVRLSGAGTAPFGWAIAGADANGRAVNSVGGITEGASATGATLNLDGDIADKTNPAITVAYSGGNVEDAAGNGLAAYAATAADDGIAPQVSAAKYVGRDSVLVTFSEPVRLSSAGAPTGWTATGADVVSSPTAGSAISVLTASATATSATLTLDSNLADKTNLDFTLAYSGGNIEDESENALAQYSDSPSDGIAPRITSAEATGRDQITVTFSESMNISDTAAQGWSVSGGDADGRTVDSSTAVSNGDTVVLTLSSDMEDTKPDGVVLQYKTSPGDVGSDPGSGSGAISDPSSNALAARQSIPVSDGIAPTLTAEATELNEITVTFSEPVSVPANAQGWSISGTDADGLDVTASTATSSGLSTVLTLSGNLADTNPDNAVLRYKTSSGDVGGDADSGSGAIADSASNALEARANAPVSDGLAPAAEFRLTADRSITVDFSEDVSSSDNDASHWAISGADAAGLAVSSVSSLTSATGSMTVALDGDVPVPSADLKLAYSAGGTISDGASLVLAAVPAAAVQDDRRPSIMSATAVERETIVVEFTRGVSSTNSASDILSAWSVSGGDAASPSVLSVQGASSLAVRTSSLTLTLSGSLPDTKPDGVTLSFDSTAASISDTESRNMADASVTVADGIAPEIESARIVGPTTIEIAYGESVTAAQAGYLSATVDGAAAAVSGLANGSTDTHTVTFSTASPAGTGAAGSVSIDAAAVTDASGNALGSGTLVQELADGQKPTVTSAKATKINEITVTFSEKVKATGTAGAAGWTISGGDSASRLVDSRSDISPDAGSTTLVLRLNGGLEDTKPEGVKLAYAAASGTVADVAPAANELDSASDIDVSDGVKPEIESAKVTGPRQITIAYSETVTHNLAHYNNINVGGSRFASGFAGANTDTAVLSFAGADTGTDATGTVQINFGAIRDGSNNALGSGHRHADSYGRAGAHVHRRGDRTGQDNGHVQREHGHIGRDGARVVRIGDRRGGAHRRFEHPRLERQHRGAHAQLGHGGHQTGRRGSAVRGIWNGRGIRRGLGLGRHRGSRVQRPGGQTEHGRVGRHKARNRVRKGHRAGPAYDNVQRGRHGLAVPLRQRLGGRADGDHIVDIRTDDRDARDFVHRPQSGRHRRDRLGADRLHAGKGRIEQRARNLDRAVAEPGGRPEPLGRLGDGGRPPHDTGGIFGEREAVERRHSAVRLGHIGYRRKQRRGRFDTGHIRIRIRHQRHPEPGQGHRRHHEPVCRRGVLGRQHRGYLGQQPCRVRGDRGRRRHRAPDRVGRGHLAYYDRGRLQRAGIGDGQRARVVDIGDRRGRP